VIPGIQQFLPFFEKALAQSNSGYLVSGGLSWIDFCICEQVRWMNDSLPDLMKQFPLLLAHANRIYALPTLQDYLKNRPQGF
jgi:glutathione S-transferase